MDESAVLTEARLNSIAISASSAVKIRGAEFATCSDAQPLALRKVLSRAASYHWEFEDVRSSLFALKRAGVRGFLPPAHDGYDWFWLACAAFGCSPSRRLNLFQRSDSSVNVAPLLSQLRQHRGDVQGFPP